MKGDRANKVQAEEYNEGFYRINRRGTNLWTVIDDILEIRDFETLHEAREWCKAHPADPDFCGKWS